MKKTYVTVALALLVMGAKAQTNLALSQSAYASSVSDENAAQTAALAVDGREGTKWCSNYGTKDPTMTDEQRDKQWFYVDLGTSQTFNTVQILWDNEPAKDFTIRVADDDPAADPATAGTEVYANSNKPGTSNGKDNYKFSKDATGRYVIISFTARATGWGYGMREFHVLNATESPKLSTFTMNAADVVVGKEATTPLTLTGKDQYGSDFDLGTITYTVSPEGAGSVADGVFTGLKAGWATITAAPSTAPGTTTTTTVYVYDNEATPAPETVKGDNVWWNGDDMKNLSDAGWDWGSTQSDFALADGNSGRLATNWGTVMGPVDGKALANYKSIHIDVFPLQDGKMNISLERATSTEAYVEVKGGQWNSLDVSLDNFSGVENATYLKLRGNNSVLKKPQEGIILKNVYFTNQQAEVPLVIADSPDANGWTVVSGNLTNDNKAQLESLDVTAIDLTNVKLASDVTTITTANPNALIKVAGSKNGDIITSEQADQLTGTNNLVFQNIYIFPIKKLVFVDGHDVYSHFFISTGATGYTYTRVIPAHSYATTMVPTTVTTLPEGLSVYDFDTSSTKDLVKFTQAPILSAAVPHVLHNATDNDITLVAEGTGDLNMAQPASATVNGSDGTQFVGNYTAKQATGSEYELQGATSGAAFSPITSEDTIGAFRAYFTGLTDSAKVVFPDTPAGIHNAVDTKAARNRIFTLDGRQVERIDGHGVYIVNGHKIVK